MKTEYILIALIALVLIAVIASEPWVQRAGQPVQATASIYSASDTAGGYCDYPDPTLKTYDPSPVEMMCLAGPVHVESRSINGLKLSELLAGGVVAASVQGTGEQGVTVLPLDQQLKTDPAQIIVLGAGMVDVFFTDISLTAYLDMVIHAVNTIRAHGKTPVVRGYHRFIPSRFMSEISLQRRDEFNLQLKLFCRSAMIDFLDCDSVPFSGSPDDFALDQLHPSAAYHQRLATFIAGRLAEIAAR